MLDASTSKEYLLQCITLLVPNARDLHFSTHVVYECFNSYDKSMFLTYRQWWCNLHSITSGANEIVNFYADCKLPQGFSIMNCYCIVTDFEKVRLSVSQNFSTKQMIHLLLETVSWYDGDSKLQLKNLNSEIHTCSILGQACLNVNTRVFSRLFASYYSISI